jgi:hypothetical protein
MKNTFKKIRIPNYCFDYSINITHDLWFYLKDNLQKENYQTFSWDLKTALKINANGE